MMDKIVRSIQIKNTSLIFTGMSVDKRLGIDAEKNSTAETLVTAMVNFVIIDEDITNIEGRNISAISMAAALAAIIGSGRCISSVREGIEDITDAVKDRCKLRND